MAERSSGPVLEGDAARAVDMWKGPHQASTVGGDEPGWARPRSYRKRRGFVDLLEILGP